jgi:hypothetical protein
MKRDCIDRCGRLTTGTRCDECQRADWRRRNAKRDPLSKAVYQSAAYGAARAQVLAGATHCATCGGHVSQVGKLTAGHRVPIRQAPELAASVEGLIPQCRSCQEREKWRRDDRT